MDSIVKQLVDIDRQAREQVDQRKQAFETLKHTLQAEKENLAEQYLARAQRRIGLMQEESRRETQAQCAALEAQFAQQREQLAARFAAEREQLVEEIVARCTGSAGSGQK